MRQLGSFEDFATAKAVPVQTTAVLPDVFSPAQQISYVFTYQSYFDSTLLQKAILRQATNDPIVSALESQVTGYAIGLHPSSQTPVAIQFDVGAQPSSSAALVIKPGQVIRPFGLPKGRASGAFSGFRWGLPFGWLGGGLATLVVFQSPDAKVAWTERSEVIFHRARYKILAAGGISTPFSKNWPLRFPWVQAVFGSSSVDQKGSPSIAIADPTRILMQLRLSTLAAPGGTMRMMFEATNDFGLDSANAIITGEAASYDIGWPTWTSAGVAGVSDYPVLEYQGPIARLAADNGGLALYSGDAALQNQYVDIVRYGRL